MEDYSIEQREAIRRLRKNCPNISAEDFNKWIRNNSLQEGIDFINRGEGRRQFHYFRPEGIPKLRRLYHYMNRGLSPAQYQPLADLGAERTLFCLFLERTDVAPAKQATFPSANNILRKYQEDSDELFRVKMAAPVYGGDLNYIAICICLDEVDFSQYIMPLQGELKQANIPVNLRWKRIDKFHFNGNQKDNAMRAVIVVTATDNPSTEEFNETYEKIKSMDGVVGACLVYGDAEMILVVQADDEQQFADIVVNGIRNQTGITGTRTYIMVKGHELLDLSDGKNSAGETQ